MQRLFKARGGRGHGCRREFRVEGQHHWIRFPLTLSSGSHSRAAESDTRASLKELFQVPGDEARYAVVNYWAEDDSPELAWHLCVSPGMTPTIPRFGVSGHATAVQAIGRPPLSSPLGSAAA